jgi:diguanylate cyclase (GGDEF)-like protein
MRQMGYSHRQHADNGAIAQIRCASYQPLSDGMLMTGHTEAGPGSPGGHGWVPQRWALWSLPPRAGAYVLAVDTAAIVLAATGIRDSVRPAQWLIAALLVGACAIHLQFSHAVERIRRDHSHSPHIDLCSVWIFAGALLLPPVPQTLLIVLIYLHRWWLVGRWDPSRPPYRAMFTVAMMIAVTVVVGRIADATGLRAMLAHPESVGWVELGLLVGVSALYCVANWALVAFAVLLTAPVGLRELVGTVGDNLLETAQLFLGAMVAITMGLWPGFALLMIVPAIALHRTVLLHQLQLAERTDDKTGLLNATAWTQQAKTALLRARQTAGSLGLFMIDLDHFKQVNDRYGHLVGDSVLKTVAQTVADSVRRGDAVGRFGGEEFAVLLPSVDLAEALQIAERLREEVGKIRIERDDGGIVSGLGVSIGVGIYPDVDEETITGLMAATDSALYDAKRAGRDRVRVAGQARAKRWMPTVRDDRPAS